MELVANLPETALVSATTTTVTLPVASAAVLPDIVPGSGDYFIVRLSAFAGVPTTSTSISDSNYFIVTGIDKATGILTLNTSALLTQAVFGTPLAVASATHILADATLTTAKFRGSRLYANNFVHRLASPLAATDTVYSVPAQDATLFSSPGAINEHDTALLSSLPYTRSEADFSAFSMYALTLESGTFVEVVYVIGYDSITGRLSIVRGQEGTAPVDWAQGTVMSMRITATSVDSAYLPKKRASSAREAFSIGKYFKVGIGFNDGLFIGSTDSPDSGNISVGSIVYGNRSTLVGASIYGVRGAAYQTGFGAGVSTQYGSTSIGYRSLARDSASAAGKYAEAYGYRAVAVGDRSSAMTQDSVAVGASSRAGTSVNAADTGCVAVGRVARAYGTNKRATAIGYMTKSSSDSACSLGNNAYATAGYATAVGAYSRADRPRTLNLGRCRPHLATENRGDGNASAVAVFDNGALTALTAGSILYTGTPINTGIILDEVIIYAHAMTAAGAVTAPVFLIETQESVPGVDNDVQTAITAPVTVTAAAGGNILAPHSADRITTGLPTNPVAGVRLTLTTPPVNVTAWDIRLILKGTVVSVL